MGQQFLYLYISVSPTFFHGGMVNNFSHPDKPLPMKMFKAHNRLIAGSLSFTNGEETLWKYEIDTIKLNTPLNMDKNETEAIGAA